MLLRQLGQRVFASNGFKRYLRLEYREMVPAGVFAHFLLPSQRAIFKPVLGRQRLSICSDFRGHLFLQNARFRWLYG